MSFYFEGNENQRSRIKVVDEPEYIVALPIAPQNPENFLTHGSWLIICMSVWSVNDVRAGNLAVNVIKRFDGSVRLGLRPFDLMSENGAWIPQIAESTLSDTVSVTTENKNGYSQLILNSSDDSSPIWVAIRNGETRSIKRGKLSETEIEELVWEIKEGIKGDTSIFDDESR